MFVIKFKDISNDLFNFYMKIFLIQVVTKRKINSNLQNILHYKTKTSVLYCSKRKNDVSI